MDFKQYTFDTPNGTICYWDNIPDDGVKTAIYLTGGAHSGAVVKKIFSEVPTDLRIISIDFPGRGDSSVIENNDPESVAEFIFPLVKQICINSKIKVNICGSSYGSTILNSILKNHLQELKPYLSSVVIVAGGEFFGTKLKIVLNQLLKTINNSDEALNFFFQVLRDVFKPEEAEKLDVQSIKSQLASLIDYQLPHDYVFDIPASVVFLKQDFVVSPHSYSKLKKLYPQAQFYEVNAIHKMSPELVKNVKDKVLPLLQV